MEGIKHILARNIKKSGVKPQIDAAVAVLHFHEIVTEIWGEEVAQKCQALYLKDHALLVACLSSVVVQEIKAQQSKVIKALNRRLGNTVVDRLKFVS